MPTLRPACSRFAVLSRVLPPTWSGQSVVLSHLLRGVDPARYCLLSTERYDPAGDDEHPFASEFLPGRYHHLPPGQYLSHDARNWTRLWRTGRGLVSETLARARRIQRVLAKERCTAVVACSADLVDLPAAWLAARFLGIAFLAYMFDDYTTQWTRRAQRAWAGTAWRLMCRDADGIVVTNSSLADDYRHRYGVRTRVIHNPVVGSIPAVTAESGRTARDGEVRVVYTGAVYEAHFDAFRNLVAALRHSATPARLHVYTACNPEHLAAQGVTGPVVFHPHIDHAQAREVQRDADVLFLPLAFDSPYPEIIRHATPMKMGEYLGSGRPVLVHAPAEAYICRYFRKYDCGQVVDRNDPAELIRSLGELLASQERQANVVHKALVRAAADFRLDDAQNRFLTVVDEAVARRRRHFRRSAA